MKQIQVTVSGSFHRAIRDIQEAVQNFAELNVKVLSPADPRVVDAFGDFVFVASDLRRAIKTVQNRHLRAIQASNFLWVVSPDGYIGPSTGMEIGAAFIAGIPVMSVNVPNDLSFRDYIETVKSPIEAIRRVEQIPLASTSDLLLDPLAASDHLHRQIDLLATELQTRYPDNPRLVGATASQIRDSLRHVE